MLLGSAAAQYFSIEFFGSWAFASDDGSLWEEALGTNSSSRGDTTQHNPKREKGQQLRCVLGAGVLNLCA